MGKKRVTFEIWWPNALGLWNFIRRYLMPHPGTLITTLALIAAILYVGNAVAFPFRAPAATGASTGTIAYQGRLADADGNPLTGTYNMEFRLYDVPEGGVPLWEELWTGSNAVRVSDGLFNVMLGSLNPIPMDVVTGHDTLYLGITVGTDDEMTPRVQLGSVPWAVQALTVPDGSITTEKIADGSITTEKIADGAVTSDKLTIVTYHAVDNQYITLSGRNHVTVSEFLFNNVPAGEVVIVCTLVAWHPQGTSNRGTLYLETIPGSELNRIPTHIFTDHYDQFTLHGRLQNFAGGSLSIKIVAGGEIDQTELRFGAPNGDRRFGRRCTVIGGL